MEWREMKTRRLSRALALASMLGAAWPASQVVARSLPDGKTAAGGQWLVQLAQNEPNPGGLPGRQPEPDPGGLPGARGQQPSAPAARPDMDAQTRSRSVKPAKKAKPGEETKKKSDEPK
jgi:hypothetical protein